MIVGPDFVWVHIMKCGGHAVEQSLRSALGRRRDVRFDAQDQPGWHDSVRERAARDPRFDLAGRAVIAGIRRLPHWMLSRVHYEATRPPYRLATRAMILQGAFFENEGDCNAADAMLSRYLEPAVERWIRLEHMAQDFERHFAPRLGRAAPRAVRQVGRVVNPTPLAYLKSLAVHFTEADLRALYGANPLWARLEERLYGRLCTVD